MKSKIFAMAISTSFIALAGYMGSASAADESNTAHPEDGRALRLISSPNLYGALCDKISNAKVIDRVKGTASANNRPAYVVGYKFNCISNFGNDVNTLYIGWMENTDTNQLQCVHHNQDRDKVLNDGWYACGGNFRQR